MSDWICQICKIEKIIKHPNADSLSIATVMGDYPVVIKTGQYEEGQLVGYLSIDTITPDTKQFYFLCPKAYEQYEEDGVVKSRQIGMKYPQGSVPEKYRVLKAKRIRNFYSQGMLIDCPLGMNEGDSIVDVLGLKKQIEEEEENIPLFKKSYGANAEAPPKGWTIPYYDLNGIRKYVNCLLPNEEIVLTEKINGSHADFVYKDERLWVKSRNFYKKMDENDPWCNIAIRYDLENKLKNYPGMVVLGELYGQVKGFRYDTLIENDRLMPKVRFFDVYDLSKMKYLDYDDRVKLLLDAGLDVVPELYRGQWTTKEEIYKFAEGLTTLGGKHIREGAVLVPLKERYEPRLDSRLQLKIVGEGYNLQK
jgi:RNA ligase (TIGR02306 family)